MSNLKASYSLETVNLLVPLVTLPYLARTLGPGSFGLLALTQAFMLYIGVVIEYGFRYAATREVSQCRDSKERLSNLLAGVIGAKVVLSLGGLLVVIAAAHLFGHFSAQPYLFWASFFWAVSRANSLDWFYRGLEQTKTLAYLVIIPSIFSVVAIFLLVNSPDEVWLVPFIRGSAGIITLIASFILAYSKIPLHFPTTKLVIHAFKSGWPAFLFRGTANLSAVGNSFILGLVAPVHIVGYYAGAEKIIRALLVFIWPANWTLYTHLCHLIAISIERAAKLARFILVIFVVLGSVVALLTILVSPYLVKFVLGTGYEDAIPALLVLTGILPLIAFTAVLGTQWMFALGLERQFTQIVAATGLVKLAGIVVLAPDFGHVGVAFAALMGHTLEALILYVVLIRSKISPFQKYPVNLPNSSPD